MNKMLVPVRADYYARTAGFSEYLDRAIEGHKRAIDEENMRHATNFEQACANWKEGNLVNRDRHLPLTVKPVAEAPRLVQMLYVTGPGAAPAEGDNALTVTTAEMSTTAAGIYMWEEMGTAAVCPDLPAVVVTPKPVPEPEHVVGVPADDAIPVGLIVTAPDGSKWQKRRATSPFGTVAWLERVA